MPMRVVADQISVVRGEELILHELSFSVSASEALAVRGVNGAGKSTLLRALAGLLPLEGGMVRVEDATAAFKGRALSDLCHYLGHENAMKPQMSVQDNLGFWQDFCGYPHLTVDEALEMVALDGLQDVPFGHLSTGQRRRISIARLLVSYKPVWLLDEPTSGLDAASEKQFADLMGVHLEDGGLIIAAIHTPLGLPDVRFLDVEAIT